MCGCLPGLSVAASYRAVGNGVPIPMAGVVARAVTGQGVPSAGESLCEAFESWLIVCLGTGSAFKAHSGGRLKNGSKVTRDTVTQG